MSKPKTEKHQELHSLDYRIGYTHGVLFGIREAIRQLDNGHLVQMIDELRWLEEHYAEKLVKEYARRVSDD